MKIFSDLFGNYKIWILIGMLFSISSISCIRIEDCRYDSQKISIADIMVTCLYDDNANKLKTLLDKGLPINNYYNCAGNNKGIVHSGNDSGSLKQNRTIILEALHLNAINCVRLLLDNGADVLKLDEEGNNALIMIAYLSEEHVVEIANKISLDNAFDVNATNLYNVTALGAAVRRDNGEYVRWLLNNGADYMAMNGVEDCKFRLKRPILFDAVNSRKDIFDLLLTKQDAYITYLDCRGNGILAWLKPNIDNYEARFKFLINRGAKITDVDKNHNVLIINMRKLGDCGGRISMICSYDMDQEALKSALLYAKKKNFSNCVEVIERRLKSGE